MHTCINTHTHTHWQMFEMQATPWFSDLSITLTYLHAGKSKNMQSRHLENSPLSCSRDPERTLDIYLYIYAYIYIYKSSLRLQAQINLWSLFDLICVQNRSKFVQLSVFTTGRQWQESFEFVKIVWCLLEASWVLLGLMGAFWVLLGAFWVPSGWPLCASWWHWVPLGCLLGASGVLLVWFWVPPGCSWVAAGWLLGASGFLLVPLKASVCLRSQCASEITLKFAYLKYLAGLHCILSVWLRSATLGSVHGYARVHSSACLATASPPRFAWSHVWIYGYGNGLPNVSYR